MMTRQKRMVAADGWLRGGQALMDYDDILEPEARSKGSGLSLPSSILSARRC